MTVLTLTLEPVIHLSRQQFYQLCQTNPDLKLERTAQGDLIVMPPTGGETGKCNLSISSQLWIWNESTGLGEAFDSSTGFALPNGSDRSPDVAWVEKARWQALTLEQRERFVPLCPDFVVELRSPSDTMAPLQQKMQEYLDNGCRLGWLIDRQQKQVTVYRPGQTPEVQEEPLSLSAESVLPGFCLNLNKIWE
jgi:Uma2 family endonuclease